MKELYRLHAEMCKTFSSPARIEILDCIGPGKSTVMEIVERTGLGQANVSQHLAIMKYSGAVKSHRKGRNVIYSVASPKIIKAFNIIRQALKEKLGKNMSLEAAILDKVKQGGGAK